MMLRVGHPEILQLDPELLAHGRQVAREEDVGRGRHLEQQVPAGAGRQVDGHPPLAPVWDLDERVGSGPLCAAQQVHQTALRIAVGRFDLDHVRTEIGQSRSGGRDERPGRDLEHADTFEWAGHVRLPPWEVEDTTGIVLGDLAGLVIGDLVEDVGQHLP